MIVKLSLWTEVIVRFEDMNAVYKNSLRSPYTYIIILSTLQYMFTPPKLSYCTHNTRIQLNIELSSNEM